MIVAANNHGTCYVWRMLRGTSMTTHFEPLHKLRAHSGYILKALISPDVQQLATTSSDKTVKLWNLDSFTLDRTLTGMLFVVRTSWHVPSSQTLFLGVIF
jgi:G protein beta subunit-like protein